VPKTLIFAKDDSHADDIVKIVREEFGKGNDFCQKITYRTTGAKPQELIQKFRNSYDPRIAGDVVNRVVGETRTVFSEAYRIGDGKCWDRSQHSTPDHRKVLGKFIEAA
jgi:hypothetical protein